MRDEIGRCYVIGADHACITLTNHLLERYLKSFLILKESNFLTLEKLEGLKNIFEKANEKYLGLDLSETLGKFKKLGFITKEEWKKMDVIREQYRNGFGHADPRKILGEAKGNFTLGSFSDPSKSEVKELEIAKIPILHGIAIQFFSESKSLLYFVEVENLIRKTINQIQPEEHKSNHKIVAIVPKER